MLPYGSRVFGPQVWSADGDVRINPDLLKCVLVLPGLNGMGSQCLSGLTALTYKN